MVPLPVFAFGGSAVIMVCIERMPASAFVALVKKSKYVRLKAIDFACIKLYGAYESSMRNMNTVHARVSADLPCFATHQSPLYRTFFNFSTISSCCGCKILRREMCRRFFIHIQLAFMHFIAMVPLLVALDGGCDRER